MNTVVSEVSPPPKRVEAAKGSWPRWIRLCIALSAALIATIGATRSGTQPSLPARERPPIVLHIGGIGVGTLSTDVDVVKKFGQGKFVEDEGHCGGRYFTNAKKSLTFHTEMGVDPWTDTIELPEGIHIRDVSVDSVPTTAISSALDSPPQIDHGLTLGMTAAKLLAVLGRPNTDETKDGRRVVRYETDYKKDDRVTPAYEARYEFVKERLATISLYDGE